jgi:hypothetical protein
MAGKSEGPGRLLACGVGTMLGLALLAGPVRAAEPVPAAVEDAAVLLAPAAACGAPQTRLHVRLRQRIAWRAPARQHGHRANRPTEAPSAEASAPVMLRAYFACVTQPGRLPAVVTYRT